MKNKTKDLNNVIKEKNNKYGIKNVKINKYYSSFINKINIKKQINKKYYFFN